MSEATLITFRCPHCNGLHTGSDCTYRVEAPVHEWTLGALVGRTDDVARHQALRLGQPEGRAFLHTGHKAARDTFLRRSRRLAGLHLFGAQEVVTAGSLSRGTPYRVDRRVHGVTLATWLERGALTQQDIWAIGSRLGNVLYALHRLGLPHGAVELDNVLARRTSTGWEVKMTRFAAHAPSVSQDIHGAGLVLASLLVGHPLAHGAGVRALENTDTPEPVVEALRQVLEARFQPASPRQLLALTDTCARMRAIPEVDEAPRARCAALSGAAAAAAAMALDVEPVSAVVERLLS